MEKEFDKIELAKSVKVLWDPLSDEQRELFVENMDVRHMDKDQILFEEGQMPTHLYYLIQGKVTIFKNGIGGMQQIVRMVEPGAIFGYVDAFEGGNYHTTALTGNDTHILQIPISLTFHFIWENSNFAMLFLKELSMLIGSSVERTLTLTQKHIRGRLADTLLYMREKYGVEEDGQTLAVYLSRSDLALISNMTTSNAIRTLSSFAQEKMIEIIGRKIRFVDIEKLQQVSDRG